MKPIDESKLLKQGKRGILHIIFSRTMLIILMLLFNCYLVLSLMFGFLENVPLLFGSLEVFTAVMLIYVLNTDDTLSFKLSWCVVIGMLPLFGAVLYLFVRFDMGQRLNRKLIASSIGSSVPYIPAQEALTDQIRQADPDLYNLTRYLKKHGNCAVYSNTDVRYFPLGEKKFEEMLVQLEKAEKFIFLEYFSIAPGYLWETLLPVLCRKAREGVEVRLMYDGMNAVSNLPYDYPKQLAQLGIKCKMFAPVKPFVSTHYNNRDHRKILIIDGHTAFTGGVNLEDRYINKEEVYGHWKDTAIMVQGEAAQGFTLLFLQMWNATEREHLYEPYLQPVNAAPAVGYVIPYGDNPTDKERVGKMVYLNILNQARDYVYIMTPYLILDGDMRTALCFAAKRSVDVRLILPHIPDKKYAFALARSHYKELIGSGVKIYEYTPGFIHAKVFLSDDKQAVVGTINLDYRSLYLHHECAAYLYKVPALADIMADFRDTMEKSQEVTMEDVKKLSLAYRFAAVLLKVIAPLM